MAMKKNELRAFREGFKLNRRHPTRAYCKTAAKLERMNGDPSSQCRAEKCSSENNYSELKDKCWKKYGIDLKYKNLCQFAINKDECKKIKQCDCYWGLTWGQFFFLIAILILTGILIALLCKSLAGGKKEETGADVPVATPVSKEAVLTSENAPLEVSGAEAAGAMGFLRKARRRKPSAKRRSGRRVARLASFSRYPGPR